jgi:hypothetical protein
MNKKEFKENIYKCRYDFNEKNLNPWDWKRFIYDWVDENFEYNEFFKDIQSKEKPLEYFKMEKVDKSDIQKLIDAFIRAKGLCDPIEFNLRQQQLLYAIAEYLTSPLNYEDKQDD